MGRTGLMQNYGVDSLLCSEKYKRIYVINLNWLFYLSEESVCPPVRSPNYSLSDANPRIALLLMAVFSKCQTKIYM